MCEVLSSHGREESTGMGLRGEEGVVVGIWRAAEGEREGGRWRGKTGHQVHRGVDWRV